MPMWVEYCSIKSHAVVVTLLELNVPLCERLALHTYRREPDVTFPSWGFGRSPNPSDEAHFSSCKSQGLQVLGGKCDSASRGRDAMLKLHSLQLGSVLPDS